MPVKPAQKEAFCMKYDPTLPSGRKEFNQRFFAPLIIALLPFLYFAPTPTSTLQAQTTRGMVAYYPLDSGLEDVTGNTVNLGVGEGNLNFGCGVLDQSLVLNGLDNQVNFGGLVAREFNQGDFSISFYFKPDGLGSNTQYLFAKQDSNCMGNASFFIRYQPNSQSVNVFLSDSLSQSVSIVQPVEPGQCWQHLVLTRDNELVRLYINGEMVQSRQTNSIIDITTSGPLVLGDSECPSGNEEPFGGLIDELRVYNRELSPEDVQTLFFSVDRILTQDTTIFQGSSVNLRTNSPCAISFNWMPTGTLDRPDAPNPVANPFQAGTIVYTVEMADDQTSCIATDSVAVTVLDPADLPCDSLLLPTAFTPNGDGLNDNYGITNPNSVEELVSFEIFDRWGGRMFFTTNPFDRWNGAFRGEIVNPGVYLYRIEFRCDGEQEVLTGGVTVIK